MKSHAVPMEEVRRANARQDTLAILLLLALALALGLVVIAGAIQCSPLLGGQLCEAGVIREGLRFFLGN